MKQQVKETLWTKQYVLIISMTLLYFTGMQTLLGGFPIFVAEVTDNPANGGLMTTTFMLAALLSRPFIGIMIPKIDMKKWLIIAIAFTLATVLFSYFIQSLPLLILARALHGIGFGFITTLLATLATNLIPTSRLGEGIGYFGMSTSIGSTLGPMIAIAVIHSFSFHNLLIFAMFILLIVFAGSQAIRNNAPAPLSDSSRKKSVMDNIFDSKAFLPCFLVMLFYITFGGVVNFLDGLGASTGLDGKTSVFFLVTAIMLIATRPFSGVIFDRFGHKYLIYPAGISAVVGLLLLSITKSFGLLVLSAVFYGIAYGVMQPTFQAWAVSRVHPDNKATANAMSLSFMDLGQAVGAFALGQAVGIVGYSPMYGIAAVIVAVMVVIYFGFHLLASNKRRKMAEVKVNLG